jgi:dihydrofolate reductase
MRKVILGVAISLDGLIEGPNGEYDWCFTDQDYGMGEFLKSIDAIFYGRKSYELSNSAGGGDWFGNIKSYVFTKSASSKYEGAEIVNDLDQVKAIKNQSGKNIWLFGGADLTAQMMNAGLVDELWLAIHPIVLGKGKPLFSEVLTRIKLELRDSKAYNTGLISARYSIVR